MRHSGWKWIALPLALSAAVPANANDPISLLREFDSDPTGFVKNRIDGLASHLKSTTIKACGRVCERGAEVEKAGKLNLKIQSDSMSWLECAFSKFSVEEGAGACEPEPADELFASFAGKAKATLKSFVPPSVSAALGQVEKAQANVEWAAKRMSDLADAGSSLKAFATDALADATPDPEPQLGGGHAALPEPTPQPTAALATSIDSLAQMAAESSFSADDLKSEFAEIDAERERQAELARLARLEEQRRAAAAERARQQQAQRNSGGGLLGDILGGLAVGAGLMVAHEAGVPMDALIGAMTGTPVPATPSMTPQTGGISVGSGSGSCINRVAAITNKAQAPTNSMCTTAHNVLQGAIQLRSIAPSCPPQEAADIRANADNLESWARETIRQICIDK